MAVEVRVLVGVTLAVGVRVSVRVGVGVRVAVGLDEQVGKTRAEWLFLNELDAGDTCAHRHLELGTGHANVALSDQAIAGWHASTDGGRTWEGVRTIMAMGEAEGLPQDQNGCGDPGILVDDVTGRVFCFGLWVHGKPGKHQWHDDGSEPGFEIGRTAQFMVVHSDDDGVTWSEPENLTRSLKEESWWLLAPAPQAGFTRADGTLVMPVQGRFAGDRLDSFATIMTSTDRGADAFQDSAAAAAEREKAYHNGIGQIVSVGTDLLLNLFADPVVILGKAAKGAEASANAGSDSRASAHPEMNSATGTLEDTVPI